MTIVSSLLPQQPLLTNGYDTTQALWEGRGYELTVATERGRKQRKKQLCSVKNTVIR